jgi:hypothetical protein
MKVLQKMEQGEGAGVRFECQHSGQGPGADSSEGQASSHVCSQDTPHSMVWEA